MNLVYCYSSKKKKDCLHSFYTQHQQASHVLLHVPSVHPFLLIKDSRKRKRKKRREMTLYVFSACGIFAISALK